MHSEKYFISWKYFKKWVSFYFDQPVYRVWYQMKGNLFLTCIVIFIYPISTSLKSYAWQKISAPPLTDPPDNYQTKHMTQNQNCRILFSVRSSTPDENPCLVVVGSMYSIQSIPRLGKEPIILGCDIFRIHF